MEPFLENSNENPLKYKFLLPKETLEELQQLTEEKDLAKIMSSALQLYYVILKYQVDNFRLCMMPVLENNEFDESRQLVFITETYGVKEDE